MEHKHHTPSLSIVAFLLLAANLRPALTSVGPLIGTIRETTGLSLAAAGILSSLPLLAFAAFAPLAGLVRRYGIERMIVGALLLLCIGIGLRSFGSVTSLFAGTACLAAGIAVANILLPGMIKRDYPNRIKGMTTIYAVTLGLTAAVASGLAYPLSTWLPGGWQAALAIWAVPAVIAVLFWLPAARKGGHAAPASTETPKMSLLRSPLAWCLTAFMGLQSLYFYVAIAWFPTIFQSFGYDPAEAGFIITLFQLVALVMSATLPLMLGRTKSQSVPALVASSAMAVAVAGLIIYPSGAYLWMILMGLGGGACLPLALSFIGLRTVDHHQAASLSLMTQSLGYLMAALGPFTIGLLHDLTGSWTVPLALLTVLGIILALVGFQSGRDRTL